MTGPPLPGSGAPIPGRRFSLRRQPPVCARERSRARHTMVACQLHHIYKGGDLMPRRRRRRRRRFHFLIGACAGACIALELLVYDEAGLLGAYR